MKLMVGDSRTAHGARWLLRAISALAAMALVLLLTEGLLRIGKPERFHIWQPGLHRVFRPLPEAMPGVTGDGVLRTSVDGLRADAIEESQEYRLLAIGGSTTESLYLDDSEIWTKLLQSRLNASPEYSSVWVGNAGKSGHTTRHHRLQVAQLLAQHPEVDSILLLAGINDMLRMLAQEREWQPMHSPEALSAADRDQLMQQAFDVHPGWDAHYPLWKRTELWRRARRVANAVEQPKAGVVQDRAGRYLIQLRGYRRGARVMRAELPDMSLVLEEFERNLESIINEARQHDVRPILLTQPTLWHGEMEPGLRALLWAGGVGSYFGGKEADYYTIEALKEGIDQFNRRTLQLGRELGVECVDLAASLPKDESIFYDDMHFTEGGSKEVARLISIYLLSPDTPPLRR